MCKEKRTIPWRTYNTDKESKRGECNKKEVFGEKCKNMLVRGSTKKKKKVGNEKNVRKRDKNKYVEILNSGQCAGYDSK